MRIGNKTVWVLLAAVVFLPATAVAGPRWSEWGEARKLDEIDGNDAELNTPFLDGCPISSPDGLSVFMASNRPRFVGDTRTDLDIWVAHRESTKHPYGPPENLGAPVNSTADDFCPTPVRGGGLFFVSRRATAESCGLGDIYFTRLNPVHGWRDPRHLDCAPTGPNSSLDEQGPSYVEADGRELLYFSRSAATVPGEVYVSERSRGGSFGSAAPVSELNLATANDIQPNVSKNGLEIVFSSNRAGTIGGQDVWSATRVDLDAPWSVPVNLGTAVNTSVNETRPSLSWHGDTLLFGRAPGPEGSSDIYVSERTRLVGADR